MQGVRIELGPRQIELVLKSIEIIKRTLTEFQEEEAECSVDTVEELSRIAQILTRAKERYEQTTGDAQLELY
jgi:hypothetical protein